MSFNKAYAKDILEYYDRVKANIAKKKFKNHPGFNIMTEENNNVRRNVFHIQCPMCNKVYNLERDKMPAGVVSEVLVTCPYCGTQTYVMGCDIFDN